MIVAMMMIIINIKVKELETEFGRQMDAYCYLEEALDLLVIGS